MNGQAPKWKTGPGGTVDVLAKTKGDQPAGTDRQAGGQTLDRDAAEQQLQDSVRQWHAMFDAMNDAVLVTDLEGRLLRCNQAAEKLLGASSDEAIGRTCCELLHGRPEPMENCPLLRVGRTGRRERVELPLGDRWFQVTIDPVFDDSGRLVGAIHVVSDITERRGAEQALRESRERHRIMIENLPVGLFRKASGLEGPFLLANEAIVSMFGCESREEFLRADMADFFERPDDWRGLYDEVMARRQVITKELAMRKKDGTPMWGAISASVVRDASGEVEHINGLIEDITERKLLETQLAQAQKLEAMGQLAAGIAHEINTPTQYIGDNTRFLQEGFESLVALLRRHDELLAEIPTAIRQTLEGVGRVVEIVRAMKEFSHPDTDEKAPTDLNEIIKSTVTLARNEWKYVAEVQMDLDDELPNVPLLQGDIKQVILNILVNAAHAIGDKVADGEADKGTITVTTRREGDWAEVRIADSGTGIPEEIRAKVFDLFFTTKDVGKGTGQGLAISRAVVVEKHAGTIAFDTEPGEGTTFVIRLPINAPPRSREGPCA